MTHWDATDGCLQLDLGEDSCTVFCGKDVAETGRVPSLTIFRPVRLAALWKPVLFSITQIFPHWFCSNFKAFADREDELPIDQHELIALIAPRAVAVGSASEDRWADPRGEFLSVVHAAPVFALFGNKALGTTEIVGIGSAVHGDQAHYHLRAGKHNLTLEDWRHYWDFADRVISREAAPKPQR